LVFESSEHGKPYLKGNSCYFNISHSGDLIALAISDKEVGLDLEYMRERNFMALAEHSMQSKLSLIREAADPRMEFYRWWTVFEAGVKLAGLSVVNNRDTYPEHFYTAEKYGYMLSIATEKPEEVKFEGVIVPPFGYEHVF
jgi:4'-phosphopantetheinyl transferase